MSTKDPIESLNEIKSTFGGEKIKKIKLIKIPSDEDMKLINSIAARELNPRDVYTFTFRLCDSTVGKDYERLTPETVKDLARMFEGKTGTLIYKRHFCDCTARIFRSHIVVNGLTTSAECEAFIVRGSHNKSIITEIETRGRILASIGCSVGERICSICGKNIETCEHKAGSRYDMRLCYVELTRATDAYDWALSFT